ncbi:MAG: hypothetical protein ACHQ50_03440 [Fimbriimonadales bacterium]
MRAVVGLAVIPILLIGSSATGSVQRDRAAYLVHGLPDNTQVTHLQPQGDRILVGTVGQGLWALPNGRRELEKIEGLPDKAYVDRIAAVHGRALIGTRDEYFQNPYVSAGEGIWSLANGKNQLERIKGLPGDTQATSFVEVGGRTFIGTYSDGVWAVPDGQLAAIRIAGLPDYAAINQMTEYNGHTLIDTWHQGIWILEIGGTSATKIVDHQDDGIFPTLCFAHLDHRTLIGTSCSGMWTIEDGSMKAVKVDGIPHDDVVRCIATSGDRAVIGSQTGIYVLRAGARLAVKIIGPPKGNGVDCIAKAGANLFVGTALNGLWVLSDTKNVAKRVRGVPSDAYVAQFAYAGEAVIVWRGDLGGPVWVLDQKSAKAAPVAGVPDRARVWDTAFWGGRVLIGTTEGLWAFDL